MVRRVRRVLVLGLFLLSPAAAGAQPAPGGPSAVTTYDELLALALANNRTLKIADLQRDKSREDAGEGRANLWPTFNVRGFEGYISQLDFTFGTGAFGTFPATGPVPPETTAVTSPSGFSGVYWIEATQPLSPLYRINLNVDQAVREQDVMEERRRARALGVASELRRVYNAVLESEAALAAAVTDVALYAELERLAGQQVTAGAAFPVDAAVIGAERARRDVAALTARHAVATARQHLDLIVGRPVDPATTLAPVDPPPAALPTDLDAMRTKALAQRPDVREAALRVRQAQAGVSAKKAEWIPDINLVGRFIGLRNIDVLPSTVTAVGLFFSWEPFALGRNRAIAARGRLLDQATLALQETEAQARVDVDTRHRQLTEARERLRAATLGRDALRQQHQLTRVRREAGTALEKDLLESEARLAEAEREYQRAVLGCSTAEAELKRALGEM